MTSYRVAISEALLPARHAKTQYLLGRDWLGLRGQIVADVAGASLSDQVEIKGLVKLACFYPGPGYSVTPDGRLVAWITGKFVTCADHTLVLTAGTGILGAQDGIWRKVRWPVEEGDDLPALLSEPQPGIDQP